MGRMAKELVDAVDSKSLVRISRSPRNADRVVGYVLGVGSKWVLISQTGDGGYFDGLVAIRLKEVLQVKADTSFEGRFAQTQPQWPPTAPAGIDLGTTGGLIKSLSQVSPLIGVEQERRHSSAMEWVGVVDEVRDGWLWLHEVRPDATWHEQPLGYRLKRITKVEIADRYLTALATVAGTVPQP